VSYRLMRSPKTTQERRASQVGWGRSRRNVANLVEKWDDIWVVLQRSWKKFRKAQHK